MEIGAGESIARQMTEEELAEAIRLSLEEVFAEA